MLARAARVILLLVNLQLVQAVNIFKVGVVTPGTGIGQTFLRGLEWWRDKVNGNSHGGLRTNDDPPIIMQVELVVTFAASADEAAQKVMNFSNGVPEHVHVLVNTFQQFNMAVNDMMAQNQIETVLLHCSGGTPSMYGLIDLGIPRWSFQFGIMVPSSDYGTGIFQHIMSFGKRLPGWPRPRIAFFRNTGNSFANFTCDESIQRARTAGMEVDSNEIFEFTDANYNTAIPLGVALLKNSTTKLLMGCTWLNDGLKLQQEIVDQRLDVLANIITIAPTNPIWEGSFPRDDAGMSLGDYVLSPSQWHHTQSFQDFSSVGNTSTFAAEFAAANGGTYPDYLLASCTAAGIVLEQSIKKVTMGSFGVPSATGISCSGPTCFEEKLRLMIRDYDEDTMYGRVRFNRYNQNIGHEAAVVQILPGKGQAAVLPEDTADSSLYFPAPTWEKRLSCNSTNCDEPDKFRIGVISPDTAEGRHVVLGLQWWQRKVNEAGGIRTQNGVQLEVELIIADTAVNGEAIDALARDETSSFINRLTDPVQAMVSTYYGHTIAVNAEMKQEDIQKVLLHCTGGVPSWYGGLVDGRLRPHSLYQFGVAIPTDNYADGIFNFVSKRLNSNAVPPEMQGPDGLSWKIMFFRNVGNEIADYTCGHALDQARASQFEVVDVVEYNTSDPNYDNKIEAAVDNMKQNNIRLSFGCTWTEDGIKLQQILVQKEVDLHLNVIMHAPKQTAWLAAFPPDENGRSEGDYVTCPTSWHDTQTFTGTSSVGNSTAFASEYEQVYPGEDPDAHWAGCTAAGVILEKAMAGIVWNGVQQFDDSELRVAIRDIRVDTFFGEIRFDNLNQNIGHDPAVLQVQPGTGDPPKSIRTSVLPETNSQSNMIFPSPTWEWRNGCRMRSRPNGDNGLFCEAAPDDGTMQYVIVICIAVPLLFLCALYFSRMFHGVIRRRRSKYVQRWNDELEKALWEQDKEAAREADNKLRPFKGKTMFGFSYNVKSIADTEKEHSLQAGIGVGYLLSDDFMRVVKIACGDDNIKDPTFHDLKKNFFMRDSWKGLEDTFFYKSFDLTCPRDGLKGVALTDTFSREHRQKQTHFLSWSWAYTIRQVRSGLDFWIHSTGIHPSEAFLFMCFFVNNQHRILVSGQQTGSDELDRIFEGNLCRIGKMIALLDNWRKPVYLTRIWTIFEQYVAVTNQIEVKIILPRDAEANLFMTISTGTEGIKSVKDSLCTVNSATADAWSPQDKEAIQAKILNGCGFEQINEHVRQVMIAWIGDVVIGAMQRVVKGEDVLASAHKWASTSSHISEHRDFAEDLDSLQHVRSML